MSRGQLLAVLLAAATLAGVACGRADQDDNGASGTTGPSSGSNTRALTGSVVVSGATSLTDAFTRIGDEFTAAHPDVEVTFNFNSSSTLATQIREGAPADVYASADEANMSELVDEGLIAGELEIVARNELVIVTKPTNPDSVTGLADLARAGVISLCGEEVPCGRYAEEALTAAGVTIPESSVTRGQNVAATLTAVTEGDAVAGIVYMTDAESAGGAVQVVAIPADQNVVATYPIGVVRTSRHADVASAFVAFVSSDRGRAVLEEHGFLPPP